MVNNKSFTTSIKKICNASMCPLLWLLRSDNVETILRHVQISFLQRLQDFLNINSRWFVTSKTIMDIIAFPFLCCLSATLLVETCTVCAMQTFLLLKLITKFNIHSLSTASETCS